MAETAYPLTWPMKQRRTKTNDRIATAPFTVGETYDKQERNWDGKEYVTRTVKKQRSKEVSVAEATNRLELQLDKLGADHPILSTNIELTLGGAPKSGRREPDDPGAAVWFTLYKKRTVFACDKWRRCADNIAALAAHIRAIRSVENYGVGTMEQAFRGYQQLEDFSDGIPWRRVLGFKDSDSLTLEIAEQKYRQRAREVHPDLTGEGNEQMVQLNTAIKAARQEFNANNQTQGE